jgi:hypothetical protein
MGVAGTITNDIDGRHAVSECDYGSVEGNERICEVVWMPEKHGYMATREVRSLQMPREVRSGRSGADSTGT